MTVKYADIAKAPKGETYFLSWMFWLGWFDWIWVATGHLSTWPRPPPHLYKPCGALGATAVAAESCGPLTLLASLPQVVICAWFLSGPS